ncbi:DinB family protein [Flavobacteriaceae bacterium F08102]|nr:DinB family protein [Flavobacteriaceae bacterium F08102]
MAIPVPFIYPPYYEGYLQQADFTKSLVENLNQSKRQMIDFCNSIPKEKESYAYAQGKWTVKEVIQHCLDTERIFAYRALRFARNDQTQLAGYDEEQYGKEMCCNHRSLGQLVSEFERLRDSNIDLFESFSSEALKRAGVASGQRISVEAIGYILTGHLLHHMEIVQNRYLG